MKGLRLASARDEVRLLDFGSTSSSAEEIFSALPGIERSFVNMSMNRLLLGLGSLSVALVACSGLEHEHEFDPGPTETTPASGDPDGLADDSESVGDTATGGTGSIEDPMGTAGQTALGGSSASDPDGDEPPSLYTQTGTDLTWEEILEQELIAVGEQSTDGILGSHIDVDNTLVEQGPYADNPIPDGLRIHTLGNSSINESSFHKWSRWYQEDGNTQIFRLFEGETNVRNDRELAARIEAFSPSDKWMPDGTWHEFEARYTIVVAHSCVIFQAKGNNVDHWSVMLTLDDQGNISLNRRRGDSEIIARNMVGKSFDVRVRDNGNDYEVYLDGEFKGSGTWERTAEIGFRWGLYLGANEVKGPIMIFVTGVSMK